MGTAPPACTLAVCHSGTAADPLRRQVRGKDPRAAAAQPASGCSPAGQSADDGGQYASPARHSLLPDDRVCGGPGSLGLRADSAGRGSGRGHEPLAPALYRRAGRHSPRCLVTTALAAMVALLLRITAVALSYRGNELCVFEAG